MINLLKKCEHGPWSKPLGENTQTWCCIAHSEEYCKEKEMNKNNKFSKSDQFDIECKDCKTLACPSSIYAYGKQKCSQHRNKAKEQI